MKILIVNAQPSTALGHNRFLVFRYLVQKSFMEQNDIMDKDIEYIVRDSLSINDFLYEIQNSYVNQAAHSTILTWFLFQDVVDGENTSIAQNVYKSEQILFCFWVGYAQFSFHICIKFSIGQFTLQEVSRQINISLKRALGIFIITIQITNHGIPRGNAGIHNTKAAQEFQTLGKYVLKAPVYRPTKFIDKTSEVFTSKSNELVVYPRTAHLSHYAFENVQGRFVATSASKWDIHTFSFASADRAFKVLAESDRGPVVIEYGSYCLGTYFEISIQYAPTINSLENTNGCKGRRKLIRCSCSLAEIPWQMTLEFLYKSAPNIAAKKTFNQLTKNIPIAQRSFTNIKPQKRSHFNDVTHYEKSISRVQETKIYSRQDIMKMFHPNVEVRKPSHQN